MPNINVYDMKGARVGEMELNDDVFALDYNEPLIHQAVVTYLANQRQGTKGTLTRSEVSGGGIKPWRQKGTGRARQGSIRSPQWTHGGVVFAPKSRDFTKKMNISARRTAILSAISKKVADGEMVVVDKLTVSAPKTKEIVAFANAIKTAGKKTLIVMDNSDENVILAARNIGEVTTVPVEQLNTYDIVNNTVIVMTKGAVEKFEEVYA
jgi:large subunit ribosomal protein L4